MICPAPASPLEQINASNFDKLELAGAPPLWAPSGRLYQSTPLVVKGRIYVTAGFRRDVVCLDAGTGELLWVHTYDEGQRIGSRGGPGLGVGYWSDGTNERIVYVTRGYTMFSLDAKTGRPDPAFGQNGRIDLRLDDDQVMDPGGPPQAAELPAVLLVEVVH
jgi:quinoprotein glucose dehydrogenase